MSNINFTGVILDPRSDYAKGLDWKSDEIATSSPVRWREKSPEEWASYPIRNQNGSGTCVAQTGAKMLGIENLLEERLFITFSALDIYDRRANKPGAGMWGQNALSILTDYGATSEDRMPSQNMTEEESNKPVVRADEDLKIADRYRAGGYVEMSIDIDAIADIVLNKQKGVMMFTYGQYDEWNLDIPEIKYPGLAIAGASVRHAVVVVDAFIHNSEKCLLIEDSWGEFFGLNGQRIITEKWLKSRVYYAGYLLDRTNPNDSLPKRPSYVFNRNLAFGDKHTDVSRLQDILKYEGLFPLSVESTGNYLQITARGVLAWQKKHKVAPLSELESLQGRNVGPKTRATLNSMYRAY